jgi:hypothetical protein
MIAHPGFEISKVIARAVRSGEGRRKSQSRKFMCVFSLFCCVYTPNGGWKEQNQPKPEEKRPAWSVVTGFSQKILFQYPFAYIPNIYQKIRPICSINAAHAPPMQTGAFPHQQGKYPATLAFSKRFNTQLKVTFGTIWPGFAP